MKRRILVIFGSLIALVSLGWLSRATLNVTRIADFQIRQVRSPDGKYTAEVFQRMDSKLGDSSQSMNVFVWPSEKSRVFSQVQVFCGHCWHRAESSIDTGPVPFEFQWTRKNSIEISCPRFFAVYLRRSNVLGIEVSYSGDLDQTWQPGWLELPASLDE